MVHRPDLYLIAAARVWKMDGEIRHLNADLCGQDEEENGRFASIWILFPIIFIFTLFLALINVS